MTGHLATATLALLLGLAPAIAEPQDPNVVVTPPIIAPAEPQTVAPAEPQTVTQAPAESGAQAAPSETSATSSTQPAAAPETSPPAQHFLQAQKPDEWEVTSLIDQPVFNADNAKIGDVNDLITDAQGRVVAVLVGVGGFLGIGEKDVAVPFQDLKLARDENDDVTIKIDISKETLLAAPDYQTLDEQEVIEGAAKGEPEGKTKTN